MIEKPEFDDRHGGAIQTVLYKSTRISIDLNNRGIADFPPFCIGTSTMAGKQVIIIGRYSLHQLYRCIVLTLSHRCRTLGYMRWRSTTALARTPGYPNL
jgi:hypothetical protein